ncbi:hypothetical protein QQ73_15535 [Candidatus Endoriftia persephone str. Guaymas]|nr:hypothetical protein [Candidatus Endoriftia persephone str. Guaymas]
MGLRYLLIGAAIWVALLIIRHLWSRHQTQPHSSRQVKSLEGVQCAHCGLHLPREEALQADDHFFCSQEHHDAYRPED